MSLTLGSFHVHTHLQRLITTPYYFHTSTHSAIDNPKYLLTRVKFKRRSILFLGTYHLLYTTWRILWLRNHWYDNPGPPTHVKVEQLIVHTVVMCQSILSIAALHMAITHSKDIQYGITQTSKIIFTSDFRAKGGEWTIYAVALGFSLIPSLLIALPIATDFEHPLQLSQSTEDAMSPTLKQAIKLAVGILYWYTVCYPTGIILSVTLCCVVFGEGLQVLAAWVYPTSIKQLLKKPSNSFKTTDSIKQVTILRKSLRHPEITQQFYLRYHYVQVLRILSNIGTNISAVMISTCVIVGVVLTSCFAYCALEMYKEMKIIAYLAWPTIFLFIAVSFLFSDMADRPYSSGKMFVHFWKHFPMTSVERRMIKACPPIGYSLRLLGMITNMMALNVTDSIVNCTVNFVLLDD